MPEFMQSVPAALAFALLSWWLGTGAILWLVRLRASSFRWSLLAATLVLILGLIGSGYSMRSAGSDSAYLAFASVILMWSWHELAFLTGWLTGPRRVALQVGAQGKQRLVQSVQAVAYHEVALLLNKQKKNYQEKGIRVPEYVHTYIHTYDRVGSEEEARGARSYPAHASRMHDRIPQDADADAGVLQALRQREGP